jgi:hypothetical protein
MKQKRKHAGQTFGEKNKVMTKKKTKVKVMTKKKTKVKVITKKKTKAKAMRISIIRVSIIIMVSELPDDTDRTMGHNIDVHSLLKILFI